MFARFVESSERIQKLEVRPHGGVCGIGIGDVLAEIVDGHEAAGIPQYHNGRQRIVNRLPRHEPVHDIARDRHALGHPAQPLGPTGGEDRRPRHLVEDAGHQFTSMCGYR